MIDPPEMPIASMLSGFAGPRRSASLFCFLTSRLTDQASPSRLRYTTGWSIRMLRITPVRHTSSGL